MDGEVRRHALPLLYPSAAILSQVGVKTHTFGQQVGWQGCQAASLFYKRAHDIIGNCRSGMLPDVGDPHAACGWRLPFALCPAHKAVTFDQDAPVDGPADLLLCIVGCNLKG